MKSKILALALFLTVGSLSAQVTPGDFNGVINSWTDKTKDKAGTDKGFKCVLDDIKEGQGTIDGDHPDLGYRVKIRYDNQYVEFPELTNLGTVTFYLTGGAGADYHPNNTIKSYPGLNVEKLENEQWVVIEDIGADLPKAQNVISRTVAVYSPSPIKIRLHNTSAQSIWLYAMTVIANTTTSINNTNEKQLTAYTEDNCIIFTAPSEGTLNVYDITGKRIESITAKTDTTIKSQPLVCGIYLLNFNDTFKTSIYVK